MVNCSFIDMTPTHDKHLLRQELIQYLEDGGIDVKKSNFQNAVDKCFKYYFSEIQACTSVGMARSIWLKANRRAGTKTRLLSSDENVILDGDVPRAESNKAFFEFVVVESIPFVFKFPQSEDVDCMKLILKDVEFSNIIKNHYGQVKGFVYYSLLSVPRADRESITGSISPHYCLTLHALTSPLPYTFVRKTGERLLEVISKVSDIGYSINDVKPENIYLDSAGNVDIGDFGGYTALGEKIVEYTPEYLCEELIDTPVTKMNDRMCLVATLLALVDRKPSRVTVDKLHNACVLLPEVKNDGDGLLKRFLLSLFIE
jgi:serine/threonine protein kinase